MDPAEAGHHSALGVGNSHEMLEKARFRTAEEGLHNVTFEHGDAQVHRFPPAQFDLVISRSAQRAQARLPRGALRSRPQPGLGKGAQSSTRFRPAALAR